MSPDRGSWRGQYATVTVVLNTRQPGADEERTGSLDRLLELIQPYFEQWGYTIVFLARLLEDSAFIGAVVPGDVVLLLAGFYAERGDLELGPIIVLAFLGGLIGDTIGYLVGRLGGRRIIDRWGDRVWLDRGRIERFDRYFQEYGMWAVAVGRITPVVRTVNTFAAGSSKMPLPAFLVAAALAGAAWAAAVPVLGFLFSGSLEAVRSVLGWIGAVVFVVFVAVLYWTYRRMMRRLEAEALRRPRRSR